MGSNGGAQLFISDVNEIILGYREDGTFVIGGNGGREAFGNSFNLARDTLAIQAIGLGIQIVNYDDSDCSPDEGTISITVGTAMPVEWFHPTSAILQDDKVEITFPVAQQSNNSHYEIEHGQDGRRFTPIGRLSGDGNFLGIKKYKYVHDNPSKGINYYRVKQVDYDDQSSYSNVASVMYNKSDEISIYPNPVSETLTVNSPFEDTLKFIITLAKSSYLILYTKVKMR